MVENLNPQRSLNVETIDYDFVKVGWGHAVFGRTLEHALSHTARDLGEPLTRSQRDDVRHGHTAGLADLAANRVQSRKGAAT